MYAATVHGSSISAHPLVREFVKNFLKVMFKAGVDYRLRESPFFARDPGSAIYHQFAKWLSRERSRLLQYDPLFLMSSARGISVG